MATTYPNTQQERGESFQGYKGEVNPQVGQGIPGAEEGAQMMQLTQVQIVQIFSSAVSQALTQNRVSWKSRLKTIRRLNPLPCHFSSKGAE